MEYNYQLIQTSTNQPSMVTEVSDYQGVGIGPLVIVLGVMIIVMISIIICGWMIYLKAKDVANRELE